MRYRAHFKKTLFLATPVVLSQLGHIMVNVADSAMVGQVGPVPLAGAALAGSVLHVAMLFGIGVSYGVTPAVATERGKGDDHTLAQLFKSGLFINVALGVILSTIVWLISPVLHYFGQETSVVEQAIPYLEVTAISLFPLMIFQHFRQYLEGLANTHQAMIISLLANLLNVGLNYILIFGKFGFEPMGLLGAGWATLISRVVLAGSIFIYFLVRSKYRQYWQSLLSATSIKEEIKRIIRVGLPSGTQLVFEIGAFAFSSVMAGWLGAKSLAAHQIALNVSAVTYMVGTGISASATIRVGSYLGKNHWDDLRKAGFVCLLFVTAFMTFCCVMILIGRYEIPTWYVNDKEVIMLAGPIFVMTAFYQISDGLQVVGLGALRGLSDVKVPTFVTLFAYWIFAIPVGYLISFVLDVGLIGIWIGLLVGLTIAGVSHVWRFNQLSKRLQS